MNKDQWDPEFLKAIPIMKTRSGMQVSAVESLYKPRVRTDDSSRWNDVTPADKRSLQNGHKQSTLTHCSLSPVLVCLSQPQLSRQWL